MASITKQASGKWKVRYWLDGQQRSETFAKKGQADRFANRVEAGKDAGTWIDPRRGKTKIGPWAAPVAQNEAQASAHEPGAPRGDRRDPHQARVWAPLAQHDYSRRGL